jgi:hypothetical protein
VEEKKNALEKNIAVARGEALAATLLASAVIQVLFAMSTDSKPGTGACWNFCVH